MAAFHLINSILTIKNVIMIERKTLRWIRSSFNFSFLSGATAPLHSYVCMSVCVSLCVPHWPRFVTVAPHTGCDFYPYVYMCREPFMDNLGYSCADREQQPTAWTEHQGHDGRPRMDAKHHSEYNSAAPCTNTQGHVFGGRSSTRMFYLVNIIQVKVAVQFGSWPEMFVSC